MSNISKLTRVTDTQVWIKDGRKHCEDGPAVIYSNGDKHWYRNGERHREDGPAIVRSNGTVTWFYSDIRYENFKEFAKAAKWTDKQIAEYLLSN